MLHLTNCKPCLGDKHSDCTNNFCLCENNNHGLKKHDLGDSINGFTEALVKSQEKKKLERLEKIGRPIDQIEHYLNKIIKNDETLVKQLVRVYLSAYTNNPVNIALLAPSSEGKTFATVEVSNIFPIKDVISIGRMSPTALIHQEGFYIDELGNNIDKEINSLETKMLNSKGNELQELKAQKARMMATARICVNVKNQIMIWLDNPRPETFETVKPIMSHDKEEIQYMTTGDRLKVRKSVIRGWPAFIFCSAKNEDKNEVWNEIKTRLFVTSPNTDVAKYEEANKATALNLSRPSWAKDPELMEDKMWAISHVYSLKERLIKQSEGGTNPIINIFNEILAKEFAHREGVDMRHFRRLMDFINLETLINSEYSPELVFEHKDGKKIKSIFTTIDNIDGACKVLGNISTISPGKIKFYEEIFVPLTAQIKLDDDTPKAVTTAEIAEYYRTKKSITITTKQVLENYCKPLVDAGILSVEKNPKNESQNLYSPSSKVTIHNLEKLKSKLIETSKTDFLFVDSCLADLEKVSMKIRDSPITYRYDGKDIDLVTLKKILLCNSQNQSKHQEVKVGC